MNDRFPRLDYLWRKLKALKKTPKELSDQNLVISRCLLNILNEATTRAKQLLLSGVLL